MNWIALLAFTSTALFAQAPAPTLPSGGLPPPEKTPTPSAQPSVSASPAPSAALEKTAEPRASVDDLSVDDVQQALTFIKSHFSRSNAVSDPEFARATLQGLIDRLSPGIALLQQSKNSAPPSPFRSEILPQKVGYVRLGDLSKTNLGELQTALRDFAAKQLPAVILDLRATPASGDFESAAEVAKRFCAKGKPLFFIKKKPERVFTSNAEPDFRDLVVVVADGETAGAPEVVAAALRAQAGALVVGEKTAGQAVEFSDTPLRGGLILRVAQAEIALPDQTVIYPDGVKPDIRVALPARREVLAAALEKGVAPLVSEPERVRMNEAALVAGKNPELDAFEAAPRNSPPPRPALRDLQLQRALDLITTINVYESKPRALTGSAGER